MSFHVWGDGFRWFHDVGEAAYEIGTFCRRWGRINVTCMKEKYGSSRCYASFGISSLHGIIYPGYVYTQWNKYLNIIDRLIYKTGIFNILNRFIIPYQRFVYSLAYNRAFKKYHHIFMEIYDGADWPEDIKLTKHSLYLYNRALKKSCRKYYKQIRELSIKLDEKTGI